MAATVAKLTPARVQPAASSRRSAAALSVRCRASPADAPEAEAATIARPTFMQSMAFAGHAPELINGRAAQLAFVAAVSAELASGESVPAQFAEHPLSILIAGGLVTLASFMPDMQGTGDYTSDPKSLGTGTGPFTTDAETLNGRAAMLGLVGLLAVESITGGALLAPAEEDLNAMVFESSLPAASAPAAPAPVAPAAVAAAPAAAPEVSAKPSMASEVVALQEEKLSLEASKEETMELEPLNLAAADVAQAENPFVEADYAARAAAAPLRPSASDASEDAQAVARELAALREEVAALRQEVTATAN